MAERPTNRRETIRRARSVLALAAAGAVLSLVATAAGAPGDLDPSFGTNGIVNRATSVLALQPDGRILVAGHGTDGTGNPTIAITRLSVDGTVDSTFGSGGTASFKFAGLWKNSPDSFETEEANAILVQPDGKIVVGGMSRDTWSHDFAVARLNADGTVDAGFGRHGAVLTDLFPPANPLSSGSAERIQAMTLEPEGRIAAAGKTFTHDANGNPSSGVGLATYTPSGAVSHGYYESTTDSVADLGVDASGCLIIAANGASAGSRMASLQRVAAPGDLKACAPFASDVNLGTGDFAGVSGVAVDDAGRIVASGQTLSSDGTRTALLIARVNADGTPDASFAGGGREVVNVSPDGSDTAGDVAVQADGKLLVVGTTVDPATGASGLVLARFQPDGSPDSTFGGGDGRVVLASGGGDRLALTGDGRAVVSGGGVIARFLLDGASVPNTPAGANVTVSPLEPATGTHPIQATFQNVVSAGDTTLSTSQTGPRLPATFQLGTPATFYDLTTTAAFTGSVEVCVSYAGITLAGPARLLHYEGGSWVDVTTSDDPATQTVCGTATSLSPFVVASRNADTEPPTVSCGSADGAWHADNVSIPCTAADGGSGLVDPNDASFSLSTSLAPGEESSNAATASRQICDAARNCTTAGPIGGNKVDRNAPTLTVPSAVVVNADGPAGSIVTFSATATDGADPSPAVICSPASGSTIAIGTTTVGCTATDAAGNRSSGSFEVAVKGAAEQIRDLLEKARAMLRLPALPAVLETPLEDALNALVTNKLAACRALSGFSTAVRGLAAVGRLSAAQATELIADANRIKAVIGCG